MKNAIISVLQLLGILGLCAGLLFAWNFLENRAVSGQVEILFPAVAQDADCAVLLSGGACVVIDTGEAGDGEHILQVLQDHQVARIDCLILTHPDKDHVGGAACLVERLPVRQVVTPYFVGEKQAYNDLLRELEEKRIPVLTLSRDRLFTFGELDLRIFPPEELHYDKSNNYSLAVLAEHGDVTLFFAGDAEKKRLSELLKLKLPEETDLYKTAHHGRESKGGPVLIERLQPRFAVITAAEAEPEIARAFRQAGTETFSSLGRDLRFVSDGTSLMPQMEP